MAFILAACSSDDVLDNGSADGNSQIAFVPQGTAMSRATVTGADAATLLGDKFVVEGTFSTKDTPGTSHGFDDYNVEWTENTAYTTASNTAGWEYVGLSPNTNSAYHPNGYTQEIKYWNHAANHYDFAAYSLGGLSSGVTASAINFGTDGANLAASTTGAYTLTISDATALSKIYYSDLKTIRATPAAAVDGQYDKPVALTFHNLGCKIRVGIYENVPGYDVCDVKFYADGEHDADGNSTTASAQDFILYNANADGTAPATKAFGSTGTVTVYFPTIGISNKDADDYNTAHLSISATDASSSINFGTLDGLTAGDGTKNTTAVYIGRSMSSPTFAKSTKSDEHYYIMTFPSAEDAEAQPLRLRVDYTLKAFDTDEVIKVTDQLTTVPATYCTWLPGYAYTYLFKITDQKLSPLTFDAVQTVTDQDVISTINVPTINTYSKGSTPTSSSYCYTVGENIYITVYDGDVVTLSTANMKLYSATTTISGTVISEDQVKNAVANGGTCTISSDNTLTLTATATQPTLISEIPAADSYTGEAITVNAAVFTAAAGTYVIEYTSAAGKFYKIITVK